MLKGINNVLKVNSIQLLHLTMFSFFNRPFPPFASGRHTIWVAIFPGLVVFAILFLLRPFGFHLYSINQRASVSLVYGLATFLLCIVFLLIIPAKMPRLFNGLHWTVGKEILFFCVLLGFISVANACINMWFQDISFSLSMFGKMVGYTLLVGVVPISFAIFAKQQVLLKKYQAEAGELEARLQLHLQVDEKGQPSTSSPAYFLLKGENQEEILELLPDQWLAAEANDNYSRIYFYKEGKAGSVMFRCTLKKLEQSLGEHPARFRCHKSFLVNLSQVEHISGNAQGYRLHIKNLAETIPVSRGLNEVIRQKISEMVN